MSQALAGRRIALALAFLTVVCGALAWGGVFETTVLSCQRSPRGTRCTVRERAWGLERSVLIIADVQGGYAEDPGFDHPQPRLVLQTAGGDTPLPSTGSWSRARRESAARQLVGFAEDSSQPSLVIEEAHRGGRALAVLAALAALGWTLSPAIRQRTGVREDSPERAGVREDSPERAGARVHEGVDERHGDFVRERSLGQRVAGILSFRRAAYREVGDDPRALVPALLLVVLVSLVVGYADGLTGSVLFAAEPSTRHANIAALAATASALVAWLATSVITSWLAAGRDGVRTLELLRALGFAHLFHFVSLFSIAGLLAWPLHFCALYTATRAVSTAGRLRSFLASAIGLGFALALAVPMWLAVMGIADP